jgi:hypothetical protein
LSRPITAEADTRREHIKAEVIRMCQEKGWVTKADIGRISGAKYHNWLSSNSSLILAEHDDGRVFIPEMWPDGELPPIPKRVRKW